MVGLMTRIDAEDINTMLAIVDRLMSQLKAVDPETKSLKLYCPENKMEVSLLIKPGIIRRRVFNKIVFPSNKIQKIEVISAPYFDEIHDVCCQKDPKSDYYLDLSKLGSECESALLRITYDVESHDILTKLVERKWKKDVTDEDDNKYWMTARLRNLICLERMYGSLELSEVDVDVDVGIYENVRTALPKDFIKRIETLGGAIGEEDREKRFKGFRDYHKQRLHKNDANDFSRIGELQTVFKGNKFKEFVDVDIPFTYDDAYPEISANSLIETFGIPRQVRVTSRTNLGLKCPAAEGFLHYSPSKLKDCIDKMLG
jgi:hypothetical protein